MGLLPAPAGDVMRLSRTNLVVAVLAWSASQPVLAGSAYCGRTDAALDFTGPMALAVADFYADPPTNALDIAVTFGTGKRVVIYRNDGTGRFTPTDELAPPGAPDTSSASLVADRPTNIITDDFNGDLLPDIVGGNEGIQRFFAYMNPGVPGGWSAAGPADPDARRGNGFDLTSTDWNGDTVRDLVFCYPGRVGIALGSVDGGGFPNGQWADLALFSAPAPGGGTFTDVEVDHFLDLAGDVVPVPDVLVVDHTNSQLLVWPGDRQFGGTVDEDQIVRFTTQVGVQRVSPFEAIKDDWNGDTLPDVLVLTTEGYALYYQGAPTPSVFVAPVITDLLVGLAAPGAPRPITAFTAGAYQDVTGDGVADLVLADAGNSTSDQGFNWLTVIQGQVQNPPTFTDGFGAIAQWHYAAGDLDRQRPGSLAVFDVDGDADPDIVLLNTKIRSLTVWKNDGTGRYDGAASFAAGGPQPRGCAAADVTGDGIGDVLAPLFAGSDPAVRTPSLLVGDGAGGLGRGSLLPAPGAAGAHAALLEHFDGDSNLDLLVTYAAEQYLWKGSGGGAFAAPVSLGIGAGEVKTGEMSGAGPLDLATADRFNSRVGIWEGQGDDTFVGRQVLQPVDGYRDHVVGDFFAGAKDDIIVAGTDPFGAPGLYVIRYDDASTSYPNPPPFLPLPAIDPAFSAFDDFARLAVGDFDGSGTLDLVAVSPGGDAFLFRNDGVNLTLDFTVIVSVGGVPQNVLAADLTRDGITDLAVATTSKLTVADGAPVQPFTSTVSLPTNISNDGLAAADMDGDLLPELIVVSQRTADVTVFCNLSSAPLTLRVGRPRTKDDLTWTDAGGGAIYDVARGDLRLAWQDRDLRGGTCLAQALSSPELNDTDPLPALGTPPSPFAGVGCWWYLVKCAGGGCVSPDFGAASDGNLRFDGTPPDPCP